MSETMSATTSASRISVDVDDFGIGSKAGLRKAAELAFRRVELATVMGETAPSNLSGSGRRHLSRFVDGLGLRLDALAADVPGLRFTDPQTADERAVRTCEILQLATDLKVPLVTASVRALTHPDTGEPSPTAVEALGRIGDFADARGLSFCLRPSGESAERIADVLKGLGCPALKIGLDPAAMIMGGGNPMALIERLPGEIALFHARDGTAGMSDRAGGETRLGEGDVDLIGLLAALTALDYTGPYVVRRTESSSPIADVQAAREVLLRLLPPG